MSEIREHVRAIKNQPEQIDPNEICDWWFMRDLKKIKQLRAFLIEQAVPIKAGDSDPLLFGKLDSLRESERGRYPNDEELVSLAKLRQGMFALLNDSLRRQFRATQLPNWVPYLIGGLGLLAFVSLFACTVVPARAPWFLPLYLLWLGSMGAIGSLSFVGVNVLSIQDSATFDLSNRLFLVVRILLGVLFAVVITLPFGFKAFVNFIIALVGGGPAITADLTLDSMMLLMPFVLGFSTSIVIMILNQFIDAIQSFFGKKSGAGNAAPGAAP